MQRIPKPEPPKKQGDKQKGAPHEKDESDANSSPSTGAAVVALSLAGCGGGSSAPAAPTGKEAELVAAINKVWKEKFVAGQVDHEQLTLNQDAVDVISAYGHVFEEANETPHIPTTR